MNRKIAMACFGMWAPCLLASGAIAQERPAGVFGERLEVRVVNVEVVVEDKQGNRVSDLAEDDFRLRVDGKEVPIGFFSEISEGRLLEKKVLASKEKMPAAPNVGVEAGQRVGTSYLVFIDDYFTKIARDRNQVIQGIVESLDRLGPEDRMAIVAFDGKRIEMLTSWTQSELRLRSTLEQAIRRRARGFTSASLVNATDATGSFEVTEAGSVQDTRDDPPAPTFEGIRAASREADACATINFLERQLKRVTSGVTATLRSFGSPPGRKVMLLLSGGWPSSAYEYVMGATPAIHRTGECGHQGPKLLRPMYEVANLLGYTLYPVDVPGNTGLDDSVGVTIFRAPFRESEVQATLAVLAVETGGQAMLGESRLKAFDTVIEDTRSYYWLGFTPDWQGDDKNHKIRLEVTRPGLKVRYREGFQDLSRSKELGFMVESALYFGDLPGANPLEVRLGPVPKKGRRVEVPVEIRIPMDEVTMLPYEGRFVAELELRIGALNDAGERNEISVVPVVLSGDEPPPAGAYATYELEIKVKREPQDLVFALHDPLGDTILATSTKLGI
ncbi:MAG: VWA domain-containing protein [bacterium]|nr:VWA domain-containing protein [bacterium]